MTQLTNIDKPPCMAMNFEGKFHSVRFSNGVKIQFEKGIEVKVERGVWIDGETVRFPDLTFTRTPRYKMIWEWIRHKINPLDQLSNLRITINSNRKVSPQHG